MGGTESGMCVRVIVPANTDSLSIARQAAAGFGDAAGLSELEAADLKLVVSEACGNSIRHAYRGEGRKGPVEVEVTSGEDSVAVVVRDEGSGFVPVVADSDSLGLGIPLIASISRVLELRARPGGGVELRAELPIASPTGGAGAELSGGAVPQDLNGHLALVTVGGSSAFGPILARMIGICAARRGLTVDQLSDSLILGDALSAGGGWGKETEISLTETVDAAALTIGPLPEGGGRALLENLEVPGVGSLTKLAQDVSIEQREAEGERAAGEYLTVTVAGAPA